MYLGPFGTLDLDDTSETSLYLLDDEVADSVNTLYLSSNIAVDSAAEPFPRPTGSPLLLNGDGSPEGMVYAPQGSVYLRRDSVLPVTSLYTKTTGVTQNTGWLSVGFGTLSVSDDDGHTVPDATELFFDTGLVVSGSGDAATVDVAFYMIGVADPLFGGIELQGAQTPFGAYFPSGYDYSGSTEWPVAQAQGIAKWITGGVYTSGPIALIYSGPTAPPTDDRYLLGMCVTTPTGLILAQGYASATHWVQGVSSFGNAWLSWTNTTDEISSLSWTWDTALTSPLSINSDGSFTVASASYDFVEVCFQAQWTGYMT